MNSLALRVANDLIEAGSSTCCVGSSSVHFASFAEAVQFVVLCERAGVNMLDMRLPHVATHGFLGERFVIPLT